MTRIVALQISMVCVVLGRTAIDALPAFAAPTRGYVSRPCGFDINRNGIVGEVVDCNVCDGVTSDVDGNGVADDLRYVDCNTGTNAGPCTAAAPCRTLPYALSAIGAPTPSQIQAVCFRGTCGGTSDITQSGAAGSHVRPRSASEAIDFEYPRYPLLLAGWDSDNDGQYPPYDTSDSAVLDGNLAGNTNMALTNSGSASNVEIAHFSGRDYGLACGDGGFMKMTGSSGNPARLFVHDLSLTDIYRGCAAHSTGIVFNFFNGGAILAYAAIENVSMLSYGSFFARGAGALPNTFGPYRFKNLTLHVLGNGSTNQSNSAGFKLWDLLNGCEVLDSVFDANVGAWTPYVSGGAGVYAVAAAQCSRNWTIRNNLFKDFKQAIHVQPWDGCGGCACEQRSMTNVVIDGNEIRNTYAAWLYGDWGIQIGSGRNATATAEDVTITNNILSSSTGWEACIWSAAGYAAGGCSNPAGTITIAGNTCYGDINRHAAVIVGDPEYGESACAQDTYDVRDNVVAGLGSGDVAVCTTYPVGAWTSNYNVYDANGGDQYAWNVPNFGCNSGVSLASWRATSGGDAQAKVCDPLFADAANGDLHLAVTDSCAKDAGTSLAGVTSVDLDGDARPHGPGWDIGADEYLSGIRPPDAPTLVEVVPINP